MDYAQHGLIVSVCDNGIGMSDRRVEERQKEGHWGMAGMRERAAKLGAQFTVSSVPGKGTLIELQVPRRRAYPATRSFSPARMFRRDRASA